MFIMFRCKDTVVGNAIIRGVSGGERKRVTTGTQWSLYIIIFYTNMNFVCWVLYF